MSVKDTNQIWVCLNYGEFGEYGEYGEYIQILRKLDMSKLRRILKKWIFFKISNVLRKGYNRLKLGFPRKI